MKKLGMTLAALLCTAALLVGTVYAAELPAVMNAAAGSDTVTLYVKDIGDGIDHVYVGNEECTGYQVEEAASAHTIVMVDNSLSIQKAFRGSIKTFLTDLVAARREGDTFTLCTFSEDVSYLVQKGSDYLDIKSKIDALEFTDQESFFLKSLYSLLEDLAASEQDQYTRIIVIADGVDNEELGYTDEELLRKIQQVKVPIYTIGCTGSSNEENLKKMFSLSRLSGAKNYVLPDQELPQILSDILQDGKISRVKIQPKDALCDGSVKTIRLTMGEDYCQTEIAMPFKAGAAQPQATAQPQTTAQPQAAAQPQPQKALPLNWILLIGGAAVVVLAAVVTALVLLKKKKKAAPQPEKVDLSVLGHSSETAAIQPREPGRTTSALNGFATRSGAEKTEILGGRKTVSVCLQDLDNAAKSFEYPLRGCVVVGKDREKCQIVIDYNKYISRVHCEIIAKDGGYFVRDGSKDVVASANGTFVNEKRATPELPLPEGSVLRLGEVRFKVTYR